MTQVDRIRDMDACSHDYRLVRELKGALGKIPGVRTPWAYDGRLYLPISKRDAKSFFGCISSVEFFRQWVKAREGFDSVVYASRHVLNPVVDLKLMDAENSRMTKNLVDSHYAKLQGLLQQYPAMGLTEREERLMRLELMLDDGERMEIEDELDIEGKVKCRPGKPVEGITYYDDFNQPDKGINERISEAQWQAKCPNASMKFDDE
ncbi:MAG: hypothetical protein NTU61_06555 [Candidatus Altiarchaeota archaeon]|nr:hypothetical protein [Candidatus Altiarchaeota archaeon]